MAKTVYDYRKDQKPSIIGILLALIESWEGLRHNELENVTGLKKTCFDNNLKICLANGWIKRHDDGRYIIQSVGIDEYQSYITRAFYRRDVRDEEIETATVMVPLNEARIKVGSREYLQSRQSGFCRIQSEWPDEKVDDAVHEVMETVGSEAMARDGFEILNALNKKGVAVDSMTFCWAASTIRSNEPVRTEKMPLKLDKSKKWRKFSEIYDDK